MIRIVVMAFACLMAANAQDSGLRLSIATEQISPGIEGMPRDLTVIALTIANSGDSPQSLIVGTDYGNADHWDVSLNSMNRDGTIVALRRVQRMVVIGGYFGNFVITIPAHGSYRTLLDTRDFEYVYPDGGTTNLAGFIYAPGEQLQIVLHCGAHPVPGVAVDSKTWKGDLVSGWLKSEIPNPSR